MERWQAGVRPPAGRPQRGRRSRRRSRRAGTRPTFPASGDVTERMITSPEHHLPNGAHKYRQPPAESAALRDRPRAPEPLSGADAGLRRGQRRCPTQLGSTELSSSELRGKELYHAELSSTELGGADKADQRSELSCDVCELGLAGLRGERC